MSDEPKKKRGGARPGSGPKPKEKPADLVIRSKVDGRSPDGQSRAAKLITQLNAIDPEMMDLVLQFDNYYLELERARKYIGADEAEKRFAAAKKLHEEAQKKFAKLSFEVQGWAKLWFAPKTALDVRKYLYDKADGKAVQTINHLHDKPIEVNATLSLGEGMRLAMQRADERLSKLASR